MSRVPTGEEEARFWHLIDSAWERVGREASARRKGLANRQGDDEAYDLDLDAFLEHLGALSEGLSAEEMTDLDRVLERKLYDIDRADIHEFTDGSDDGFLYCRGFIVAMGREFYEAVRADPAGRSWMPTARRCATSSRTCTTNVSATGPTPARVSPGRPAGIRQAGRTDGG
ncbi:DUF4240 domain-containing protein [Actinophytocola sp.]|uniref:DUF4240 domain-containing protein n=1 Tax=Actinophytocola sp. TaxID=1872138 RepID=UPI002ED43FF5